MDEITEYDGYVMELPYANRELSDEEEKERVQKLEEAKEKAKELIKNFI